MSIGTIGTKTVTRTGSMVGKFIPFIYVFVEDKLAEKIIDLVVDQNSSDRPKSSVKCVVSGSWLNQAACMYGFYTYGNELAGTYQIPFFSALAVNDGDVPQKQLDQRLDGVIKGSLNEDQATIKEKIRAHTTQFTLAHLLGPNGEEIKASPEYNHKLWFEEITEPMIREQHKTALEQPDALLRLIAQHEIETLLEVIAYSKTLFNPNSASVESEKVDYHTYYTLLKACTPRRPDDAMNNIEWYVLRAIKRYNRAQWEAYTGHVRERIVALALDNYERFKNSHFDLR
ncbi:MULTISPECIES: hypothetical protein [Pseudomonas]|uniref:hypothetical protein n=1 Tax=Pseudomonas TaxID=286 RepID=UPI001462C857|nr:MULTISPECIES: hypothetical protein [Pseudomonas]NMY97586.1 hypothetical protein [Pseudomonas proteolytica]NMZ14547.1 hypothetical protein [Pseudomonas proteolytica]QJI21372.1 hypothetical protein HKK57_24900 [Pseudomonas sp. ADAK21]QJI23474.1 hypothetical protein HKK56_08190 [Pseudomonas sp. ADAK20]